nr:ead/Ea22-like family protein [Shigella flexneri]
MREAAEKATKGQWAVEFDDEIYSTDGVNHEQIAMVFSENESRDAAFIAAANPATVLALLDELERNQQYIKSRDQENEEIALTVGKLRVELEAAEALNKHLELAIRKADGCSEALRRKTEAAEKRIAELEAREVVLPQCYSMLHRVDFDEPYHTEMVYRQHQVLEALHNAGINVTEACKGEAS